MSGLVVIGAQWGDEGKGKITDFLAHNAKLVVRYQGGNNAGHTVEVGDKSYKLHLIPSGIINDDCLCIIGDGVAFDPIAFIEEIRYLEREGLSVTPDKLAVSDRAHLIMPYHKILDGISEAARGESSIGTTKKGIGPCYMDKHERSGIRVCDLMKPEVFSRVLSESLKIKSSIIKNVYGGEELDFDTIYNEFMGYREIIAPFVKDTTVLVYEALSNGHKVLFEGAQGTLLDIDYGTYPYVTSSHPISGGVCVGAGIGPTSIKSAVGVCKAYTTRVGEGPFPTELSDSTGEHIREKGFEYGTTTGRSRRCGWLDLVILKYAVRVSSLTSLAITKLDTLGEIDPLKVCIGYELDGRVIDYFPASLTDLGNCTPVYKEFKGWDNSIASARSYNDIPQNAKEYLRFIEEFTGCKVSIVSVGPNREETIILDKNL
ncbi:MAG: adenylosuccinate synthase [Clostridium sp.]